MTTALGLSPNTQWRDGADVSFGPEIVQVYSSPNRESAPLTLEDLKTPEHSSFKTPLTSRRVDLGFPGPDRTVQLFNISRRASSVGPRLSLSDLKTPADRLSKYNWTSLDASGSPEHQTLDLSDLREALGALAKEGEQGPSQRGLGCSEASIAASCLHSLEDGQWVDGARVEF